MIKRSLEALCAVLLGGMIAVPLAQIIMRYVFNSPIIGAEEFTRFLLICTVFVSYPLVVQDGENIVMDELHEVLPGKLRRMLGLIISATAAATCVFLAVVVILNISANANSATPTLGIPFWIFLTATLFGFAGAGISHLIGLRKSLHKRPGE
ncbi:MAG: TRAP transporter small permease, partial [Gimesia chilikensis]